MNRLLGLIRRELGADDVVVLEAGEAEPGGALVASLPSGARVAVTWADASGASDALRRRLEILVESFGDGLRSTPPSRPPPAQSLHDELSWLAQRAGALDAVVIDAQSPMVWGAAIDDEATPHLLPRDNIVSLDKARAGERTPLPPPDDPPRPRTLAAVEAVRALPGLAALHRGGHLREASRASDSGWLARSFAGIYVVVMVFDDLFDELRAERALAISLPSIERLVTLLPPVDPSPGAGVAAIRRPRR